MSIGIKRDVSAQKPLNVQINEMMYDAVFKKQDVNNKISNVLLCKQYETANFLVQSLGEKYRTGT